MINEIPSTSDWHHISHCLSLRVITYGTKQEDVADTMPQFRAEKDDKWEKCTHAYPL